MSTSLDAENLIPEVANQQEEESTNASKKAPARSSTEAKTEQGSSTNSISAVASLTSSTSASSNNTNTNKTICRFLIQNLKAGKGFATSDYHVDLDTSKHGLFDLVLQVFDIIQKEELTHDSYYSHLWNFNFAGVKYSNGWRGCSFVRVENHLDEKSVQTLNALPTPLANGQKGLFSGKSASFDVILEKAVVDDAPSVAAQVEASSSATSEKEYPKWKALPNPFTTELTDDWLSITTKQDILRLREDWATYMHGLNVWKYERTYDIDVDGHYLSKPDPPMWSATEMEYMGLLIRAGHKFKKSWNNVLKYVLVNRAETATSGQWYKIQKETWRLEWIGRGMAKNDMMLLVKRLAQSACKKALEAGVPPLNPPHPNVRYERILRKHGLIDDTMSASVKRQKIFQYRGDIKCGFLRENKSDDEDNVQVR